MHLRQTIPNIKADIINTIKRNFGIELDRLLDCNGFNSYPQLGQVFALSDISLLHSGQLINAIESLLIYRN